MFVEVFENAQKNENTINDAACMLLVRAARALPDVGAYIGAHLVRSLLAVHDLTLPLDAWGPFTMSDDSVGQMRELLGEAAGMEVVYDGEGELLTRGKWISAQFYCARKRD